MTNTPVPNLVCCCRLTGCKWSGVDEPELGIELASEAYTGARKWLLALREVGVTCSEEIALEYELPASVSARAPQRELLHSASRSLQLTQPPRYSEALKAQHSAELLPDDIVFGACESFGACCQQLSRDAERCCYARGFTSARGLRALVRLLDGAAVAFLAANVATLNNFADVFLACAMFLLGIAATITLATSAYSEENANTKGSVRVGAKATPLGAFVANWGAALAIFVILGLHVTVTVHEEWSSFWALAVNWVGLLIQIYLIASLASAMVMGTAAKPEAARGSIGGSTSSSPTMDLV